jgi:hypothetical protein
MICDVCFFPRPRDGLLDDLPCGGSYQCPLSLTGECPLRADVRPGGDELPF